MTYDIVISRHPGAIEWLRDNLMPQYHTAELERGGTVLAWYERGDDICPCSYSSLPIIASATPDDVRGKHVVGNLPLHLAALAASVTVIEFTGAAPRGADYTAIEMTAAGALLRRYRVEFFTACPVCGSGRALDSSVPLGPVCDTCIQEGYTGKSGDDISRATAGGRL